LLVSLSFVGHLALSRGGVDIDVARNITRNVYANPERRYVHLEM